MTQVDRPESLAKVPAAQAEHTEAPLSENDPGVQSVQLVDPVLFWAVPAAQLLQILDPVRIICDGYLLDAV